jgi:hypothetical protein
MKTLIYTCIAVTFLCVGCVNFSHSEDKELKEQVAQLQKEVDELKKENATFSHNNSSDETVGISDSTNTTSQKEQLAIKAIKYCLSKYCSNSEYKYGKINTVVKSDGTIDVIVDYTFGSLKRQAYYNVSVYSEKEFCINDRTGGDSFPYGDKFIIQ